MRVHNSELKTWIKLNSRRSDQRCDCQASEKRKLEEENSRRFYSGRGGASSSPDRDCRYERRMCAAKRMAATFGSGPRRWTEIFIDRHSLYLITGGGSGMHGVISNSEVAAYRNILCTYCCFLYSYMSREPPGISRFPLN